MVKASTAKADSGKTRIRKKGAVTAIVAIFAVAILLISNVPLSSQGVSIKNPDEYEGAYHIVRYHMNLGIAPNSNYNDTTGAKGFQDESGDWCLDVEYFGDVIATEYNPQLWSKTISNNTGKLDESSGELDDIVPGKEIDWNWLPVIEYKVGTTVVFTGWIYPSDHKNTSGDVVTSDVTHYPGEVLSKADLETEMVNDTKSVIHVFATWGTVENWAMLESASVNSTLKADVYASGSTNIEHIEDSDHIEALADIQDKFNGGSEYTNFLIVKKGSTLNVNGATTKTPLTIRSEPGLKTRQGLGSEAVGCLGGGEANFNMGCATIIDDIGMMLKTSGSHGHGGNGICGCGNPLIIGTGIMSYFAGSNPDHQQDGDKNIEGYPTLRGGKPTSKVNGIKLNINEDHQNISVYPSRDPDYDEKISTVLIIHSGIWVNVVGGCGDGTVGTTKTVNSNLVADDYCSTYVVMKDGVVLDTFAAGSAFSNGGSHITGSTHAYLTNAYLVSDIYTQYYLTDEQNPDRTPLKISGPNKTINPWPYSTSTQPNDCNYDRLNVRQGTVLTGGCGTSDGKSAIVFNNTYVHISGTSFAWDVQGGGRVCSAKVIGTTHVELSGKGTIAHIMCGTTTDGNANSKNMKSVGNTHLLVKDSGKAATVCGGGYDTYLESKYTSMMDGGTIKVEIEGGTVCNVYGGGMRAILGTPEKRIESITVKVSGGTVLGSVYGGGSGGFEKQNHKENGTRSPPDYSSFPDSTGRSRCYLSGNLTVEISGDAVIEGSVYGGGKSVPAIQQYSGKNVDSKTGVENRKLILDASGNPTDTEEGLTAVTCNNLIVKICGNAVVEGSVYGTGRGVTVTSETTLDGADNEEYVNLILMSPWGEREYVKWFTNGTINDSPPSFKYVYDPDRNLYDDFAIVTANTVQVSVQDGASVGESVYGAGGRGHTVANNVSVIIGGYSYPPVEYDGNVVIGDSVFGGGMKKSLTGETVNITIKESASVTGSVYGAGAEGPVTLTGSATITASDEVVINGSVFGGGLKESLDASSVSITLGDSASIGEGVYGAGAEGPVTLTGSATITASDEVVINGSVFGGGLKESLNAASVSIDVQGSTTIDSCVYGAGAEGKVILTGGTTITISDNAVVGDSVFGGGLKESLDASSVSITLGDSASITNSVYGAGAEGKVILTGGTEISTSGNVHIGDSIFGGGFKESLDASSVSISVQGSTTIDSCVYGAGSEGKVDLGTGTSSVHVGGSATVAGSVYGGGLKEVLTGNTSVTIDGEANVAASVYGGGDIGERNAGESSTQDLYDDMQILVKGNSNVLIDGSGGADVGKSVIGDGNSCVVCVWDGNNNKWVPGNRTVKIVDYSPGHIMESLQGATAMDVIRSSMDLDGRGIGSSPSPTLKYSLYNIDKLRMMDGSSLGLTQEVDEVREYESCIANGELTTLSHPSNTLALSGGVMFNTGYKSETGDNPDYRKYGLISGYTILSKDVSDEFYGAYAYGSQDSPGHFVQTKDGMLEIIHYVDVNEEAGLHDEFRLWTISGAAKQNLVLVATYNYDGETPGKDSYEEIMTPISQSPDGMLKFTGATVSLEADANLVHSAEQISSEKDVCIIVGYGDSESFTRFNYNSGHYSGVPITESFASNYIGSVKNAISRINIGMWYRDDIPFSGDIGQLNLEFQEVVPITVDGSIAYIPVCKTEVIVTIYCMTSTSVFAGDLSNIKKYTHHITIPINDGSGSGKLVIPDGYRDATLVLTHCEAEALDPSADLEMHTSTSSYGTNGWIGATGKGGSVLSCVDDAFALSGSFTARLNFDASNITTNDKLSSTPTLHFTINLSNGDKAYFVLVIEFEKMQSHKVEFFAPIYDYNNINRLNQGLDVTVIPPLFTLAGSCVVDHGSKIESSDYPLTNDYFRGWFLDPDCTKYFDTTSAITKDLKLYAMYSFEVLFHLYGETYRQFYEDIVSDNVARINVVYEDPTVSVQVIYHYKVGAADGVSSVSKHLGETYSLPGVDSMSETADGFKGWLFEGRVYSPGDSFTTCSEKVELTAIYSGGPSATVAYAEIIKTGSEEEYCLLSESEGLHVGDSIILPSYPDAGGERGGNFIGWVYNSSLYHPGSCFIISDERMVLYALLYDSQSSYTVVTESNIVAHPGSKIYLPIPASTDDPNREFRGWLLSGAFYYPFDATELEIAVPAGTDVVFPPDIVGAEDLEGTYLYKGSSLITLSFRSYDDAQGTTAEILNMVKEFGSSLKIPTPDVKEGFLGWYCNGRVYQPGDTYIAMTDGSSVQFIAMYEGNSRDVTVPSGDGRKTLCLGGYYYGPGETIRVPNSVSDGQLTMLNTDIEYVPLPVQQGEDFRGWKVGDAYYFIDKRASTYVVTTKDEVAIPVYHNDDLPTVVMYDYGRTQTASYGSFINLLPPAEEDPERDSFIGWYSKGYVFRAGYEYVITDEVTVFTPMHYTDDGIDNDDCWNIGWDAEPGKIYILNGNIYTYSQAKGLYVPNEVNWDGIFEVLDENGDPDPDKNVTVDIYFGDSMGGILANVGETVELPSPVYEDGFRGWFAGGEFYEQSWTVEVSTADDDEIVIKYPIKNSQNVDNVKFWLKDAYGCNFAVGPYDLTEGYFSTSIYKNAADGYYEVHVTVDKDLWSFDTEDGGVSAFRTMTGKNLTANVCLYDADGNQIRYGNVTLVPSDKTPSQTRETEIVDGACNYTVLQKYAYLRPIDITDIKESNPGYHTEGTWHDDDGNVRFNDVDTEGDHAGDFVDDIDGIVDDTVFHLEWIGNTLRVVPIIKTATGYQTLPTDDPDIEYEFTVTYGDKYGRGVVIATEKAKAELNIPNTYLDWEVATPYEGAYKGTGIKVYESSTVMLANYSKIVDKSTSPHTLYILANASTNTVDVKLYPGEYYIPQNAGDNVVFEAMFEPVQPAAVRNAVFDVGNDGFETNTVTVSSCYGGAVVLPTPTNQSNFMAWIHVKLDGTTIQYIDSTLYRGNYTFSTDEDAYFIPLYSNSNTASEVVFLMDKAKGTYPTSSKNEETEITTIEVMVDEHPRTCTVVEHEGKLEITVSNIHVGQTVSLPDVDSKENYRFIGWEEDMRVIDEHVAMSSTTKTVTALFASSNSSDATLRFNWGADNVHGACIGDNSEIISMPATYNVAAGSVFELPSVAPSPGYKFTGWKVVSVNGVTDGRMATDTGRISPPTDFKVIGTDEDGATVYEFKFNEGQRTGYCLSGWRFLQYESDGRLVESYTMGETVTVKKIDNEYWLYTETNPVKVHSPLEFEAVWTPIEYPIEVQVPKEGSITFQDSEGVTHTVDESTGAVTITAKYGEHIEFHYVPKEGSTFNFNKWSLFGEGTILNDKTADGTLVVSGRASVSVMLKSEMGYILTVYNLADGRGAITVSTGTVVIEHTDYVGYRISGGNDVTLTYEPSGSHDEIYHWWVDKALIDPTYVDEHATATITIDSGTVVVPFLKLRPATSAEDVYFAFSQNDTGEYALEGIPYLNANTVFHIGIADGPSGLEAELNDDGDLVISGAEGLRGYITIDVIVDEPVLAYEFKVHVFIVGPLADGTW